MNISPQQWNQCAIVCVLSRDQTMRCVKIVEKLGETYSYAAVDQRTGETPLRLSDRFALIALCQRLGWTIQAAAVDAKRQSRPSKPRDRRRRGGHTMYTSGGIRELGPKAERVARNHPRLSR